MNPFLFLLSLVAGFVLSWYLIVRKVVREAPGVGSGYSPDAVGAGSAYGPEAGVVPDYGPHAGTVGYGYGPDASSEYGPDAASAVLADLDFGPASEETGPVGVVPPADAVVPAAGGDWASRLEHAKDLLIGGAARLQHDLSERIDGARTMLAGQPSEQQFTEVDAAADSSAPTDLPGAAVAASAAATVGRRGSGATAYRPPAETDTGPEPADVTDATQAPGVVDSQALEEDPNQAVVPRRLSPWADAPADGGVPDGYAVKGDRKAKLYLLADDPDFDRARPDIWFLDEQAAQDEGYAHYIRRPRATTPPSAPARAVQEPLLEATDDES